MECVLEAYPVPDITWFHGDKEIQDGVKMKMSRKAIAKDTFNLTLEIMGPTREDGGNYRCNAFNLFGESNANIALNFQGNVDIFIVDTHIFKYAYSSNSMFKLGASMQHDFFSRH